MGDYKDNHVTFAGRGLKLNGNQYRTVGVALMGGLKREGNYNAPFVDVTMRGGLKHA